MAISLEDICNTTDLANLRGMAFDEIKAGDRVDVNRSPSEGDNPSLIGFKYEHLAFFIIEKNAQGRWVAEEDCHPGGYVKLAEMTFGELLGKVQYGSWPYEEIGVSNPLTRDEGPSEDDEDDGLVHNPEPDPILEDWKRRGIR